MKKACLILVITMLISIAAESQMTSTWRGPARDGKFPETNLLKQWPENGPKMLWAYENLGIGFSSPVLTNGKIYINGMEGETGYIYILSEKGEFIQKYPYGPEVSSNYPGTRSTPVIIDNLAYVATGHGVVLCLDINTGKTIWSKDLFNDFDGSNIRWGFTENLAIDGDLLFCSPGGKKHNIVALNRHNGNLEWSAAATGELSAYNSPQVINHNGSKILVAMMASDIIGLDTKTGKMLWSHPYKGQRSIHPNTPIYHDGYLYCFSGYGMGGTKLKLNQEGTNVTEMWFDTNLDPQMGGAVLVDGYIYGSGHRNRRWYVLDWESGAIKHESRDIDVGNVIFADGLLYAYTERGELALVEPKSGDFRVVSKTTIELGSDQHWAHLVIKNGILYVRRGNAIMAFDIKNR
jgi:outer membrane protein assembly factor BamB